MRRAGTRQNGDIPGVAPFLVNHETFTFTFMHLADAFIQSDLHCIQVTVTVLHFLSACFPWESNP